VATLAVLVLVSACGTPPSHPTTASAPSIAAPVPCANGLSVTHQPAGPDDWPVYHRAADRHGVDPTNRTSRSLAPLWGLDLDGAMSAQPLVFQGVVIEATENDSVYALEAHTGCQYWQTSLGQAFAVPNHPPLCVNNIGPWLGVTSTPAIDPMTGTIYVVAFFEPGRYEMDALDLATGAIRWRHPLDLPGSDVLMQLSRPAIQLTAGRAYVSFGGRPGDCGNYHGFEIGVRTDGQGPDLLFQVSPNRQGAIWGTAGPVLLPNGDLMVASGNTDAASQYDGSDSVIRLSPQLQRIDFFSPSDWKYLNLSDLDLGSISPILVSNGHVFSVGKEGVGYLLDVNHLGGVGGQKFSQALSGGCYGIGALAYRAPLVFVPCDHSLTAVRVSTSRFDVAWRGPDFQAGSPIVADGLVWSYDFVHGFLWAFDPDSGAVRQKVAIGPGEHFVSPSSSAGRIYVAAKGHLLAFKAG
jgi:polyvinyl alcohol dehydrogenase (cytochrome)